MAENYSLLDKWLWSSHGRRHVSERQALAARMGLLYVLRAAGIIK